MLGEVYQNLAERTNKKLLTKTIAWHWFKEHEACFTHLKKVLCQTPVLALFDQNNELVLSPISPEKCVLFRCETATYPQLSSVVQVIMNGWPKELKQCPQCPPACQQYWTIRDELTVVDKFFF